MNPPSSSSNLPSPISQVPPSSTCRAEAERRRVQDPESTSSQPPSVPSLEVLTTALDLISHIESHSPARPPSVLAVYHLYCVKNLTVHQVARRCRCSTGTIANRLACFHALTGLDPVRLSKAGRPSKCWIVKTRKNAKMKIY